MKMPNLKTAMFAVIVAGWSGAVLAESWGYSGERGPDKWSDLDDEYVMCGMGHNQSPIDLTDFVEADLESLSLAYQSEATDIINNGHTVQVNYAAGSTLTVDGHSFELQQFHFHSPSENHITGQAFSLEAHLVHADENGNLAVVAVMFEEDQPNALLTELWQVMPDSVDDENALPAGLNVEQMLPSEHDYYRFNGSLTTPPCSEGVWWLVLKETATVSKAQVEQFSETLGFANNRPIQPANARPVLQ